MLKALKSGDSVDIIAPGASFSKEDIKKVKDFLLSWELEPRISKDILGEDLLCANTDAKRFLQLKDALTNPDTKAVWCLKGGYGCVRLIAELEKMPTPKHNKLLLGFSDVTVLHIYFNQKWHWPTLHSPGARQIALGLIEKNHVKELKEIIFGKQNTIGFKLIPLNQVAQRELVINTTVTGGTLSLVQTSLGTSWQINARNKILFLEDVNERGYKVDRMLQHLKQAGVFSEVKAVIFGDFVGGDEPEGFSLVRNVIERFAKESAFPVLLCSEIGHGTLNRVLPFGVPATLKLKDTNFSLTIKI